MVRYQYQGTPINPPPPSIAIVASSTTAASAGTKHFWLQYRNRAGYSQVSVRVEVAIAAGQGITATIPAAARPNPNGSYILEYVLLMAESSDPLSACVVATYPGYSGESLSVLPAIITLSQDEHFKIYEAVAQEANLPSVNRLNGMRRAIDALNRMVEWNQAAGVWRTVFPAAFNSYVPSIAGENGANRSLDGIDDRIVVYPSYGATDGELSEAVTYWLVNDGSSPIRKGSYVYLGVELGDRDASALAGIVGGLEISFLGYANTTTGVLDTSGDGGTGTMPLIGDRFPYQGKATSLILPKDLLPGQAYVLSVQAALTAAELGGQGYQGAVLRFAPAFYANFAIYNPLGHVWGSLIAYESDRRRIVPLRGLAARALDGSGMIALPLGGGYSFHQVGESDVIGLAPNTDSQICQITINGTCAITVLIPDVGAKRAEIGTLNGVGKPTGWTGAIVLDSARVLRVTVQYPAAIRQDYPDVLAGSTKGQFNATTVRIYVRPVGGGTVQMFEQLVVDGVTSQEFVVGATAGTNLGTGALPTRSSDRFGLYEPANNSYALSTAIDTSVFTSGTYEVAIAFGFTNTVTSIQHGAAGCILEAATTVRDLLEQMRLWNRAVEDVTELRAIAASEIAEGEVRIIRSYRGKEQIVIYRGASLRSDNGSNDALVIKPSSLTALQSGRWEPIVAQQDAQYFQLLSTAPETQANEVVVYATPDGALMRRLPNNGAIQPIGGVLGSAGAVYIETGAEPATGVGVVAIWNDNGVLKQRAANNGTSTAIGSGSGNGTGGGGASVLRVQIFS